MSLNRHLEKAITLLTCPACLDNPAASLSLIKNTAPALQCSSCGARYPVVDGVIDFLPNYHEHRQKGLAQWFMENRAVVSFYERFFRPAFTRMGSPITYEEEIQWLKTIKTETPIKNVLDLACGTGKYARLLNDIYKPDLVFAVDISLPMLQKATAYAKAEKLENIIHIRGDAGALPLKNNSLERVNCFGALHLFPDVSRTFQEIGRTTSTKTVFTCLTSRKINSVLPTQAIFSRLFAFHFFDEDKLKNDLRAVGLENMQSVHKKMVLMFSCVKDSAGRTG